MRPSFVDEEDDATGRGLAANDRDRERAHQAAARAGGLEIAAEVLEMADALTERHLVHDEEVVDREELVRVDARLLLELRPDLRAPLRPDRGIERVVARGAV